MKLNVGKRILMFFHWLISMLSVAALALYLIVPDFVMKYYGMLEDAVGARNLQIIGIALLAVYALLVIAQAVLIFKRKKRSERGFITVDSSDSGRVRIAISAIEQMVRQSVGSIDGLTDMKIGIENQDDAIGIKVNAAIVNGSHVPTITMNMQRAIRQFVETNCGVAVRTVSIYIKSVTDQASEPRRLRRGKGQSAIPAAPAPAAPAADDYDYEAQAADPEPAPAFVPEPEPQPELEPEPEPYVEPEPVAQPEPEPAPAFDLDAPYESQFAKDLAAMKAAEAASAEGEGEPLDEDED